MSLIHSRTQGAGSSRAVAATFGIRGFAALTGTTTAGVSFTSASYNFAPVSGDILVAFIQTNDQNINGSDGPTFNGGTGSNWTLSTSVEMDSVNLNASRLSVYTRTATASSLDNLQVVDLDASGGSGGTPQVHVVVISATTGLRATPVTVQSQSGTTVTVGSAGNTGDILLTAFASFGTGANKWPTPTGMTVIASTGASTLPTMTTAYQVLGTPGTRSSTVTGNSATGAIALGMKP
jgi:hypothetical protein